MARPRKPEKHRTKVVELTGEPAGNVATADLPPETPFDPPITPRKPGVEQEAREKAAGERKKQTPLSKLTFFQKVERIPKEDWGTRAYIYVYCWEPICNLKMGGENKYLVRLGQPILDEQPLMVDYGSGKYHLKLVYRKSGVDQGDTVDTTEIEIYNPKYPPKIPRAVWMNDPRNERWAALLPPEKPAEAATGLGTVTEAFRTFTDIQKNMREEMTPAAPQAPAGDPMGSALQMVQTILSMKADNPMVEIMRLQLQAAIDSAEKARQREADLQKELRDMVLKLATDRKENPGQNFGLKEAIGTLRELLPQVKELFPQAEAVARAGRTTWLDLVREVSPGIVDFGGKILLAMASRMPPPGMPGGMNGAPPQLAAPPSNAQPPAAGQPPHQQAPPQNIPKFVHFLSQPSIFDSFRRYFEGFKKGATTGGDFAEWVSDGVGAEPLKEARAMGSANIMALLKQSPAWFMFQSDEAKLVEFVDQALSWTAPAEPGPEDDDDDNDDDSIDLTTAKVM